MTEPEQKSQPLPPPHVDRSRDLYILVIVILVVVIAVKFLMDFMAWDKLQTCAMSGRRNCAPMSDQR
jgi:uncharacterized membrane protein YqhA